MATSTTGLAGEVSFSRHDDVKSTLRSFLSEKGLFDGGWKMIDCPYSSDVCVYASPHSGQCVWTDEELHLIADSVWLPSFFCPLGREVQFIWSKPFEEDAEYAFCVVVTEPSVRVCVCVRVYVEANDDTNAEACTLHTTKSFTLVFQFLFFFFI